MSVKRELVVWPIHFTYLPAAASVEVLKSRVRVATLPGPNSALDVQDSTDPVGVVTAQQEPAVLLSQGFVPG